MTCKYYIYIVEHHDDTLSHLCINWSMDDTSNKVEVIDGLEGRTDDM